MATHTIPLSDDLSDRLGDELPELVAQRLTARGVAVQGVSVRSDPLALVIEADRDPAADLTGWEPGPTRDELAVTAVTQTVTAILAKAANTRTPVERGFLALAWLTMRIDEDG